MVPVIFNKTLTYLPTTWMGKLILRASKFMVRSSMEAPVAHKVEEIKPMQMPTSVSLIMLLLGLGLIVYAVRLVQQHLARVKKQQQQLQLEELIKELNDGDDGNTNASDIDDSLDELQHKLPSPSYIVEGPKGFKPPGSPNYMRSRCDHLTGSPNFIRANMDAISKIPKRASKERKSLRLGCD
ncbi:maker336 [Drosophila busckii]|uniref:Maker336 n=1 Tax=Drosophila busckii TaxID=30019 RepID=A0A0M3QZH3_DROBS|nr:uncharacterized protein LOC108606068 [Drosophila busckii]ALC49423.1 maker336 [Drosophila busckii]